MKFTKTEINEYNRVINYCNSKNKKERDLGKKEFMQLKKDYTEEDLDLLVKITKTFDNRKITNTHLPTYITFKHLAEKEGKDMGLALNLLMLEHLKNKLEITKKEYAQTLKEINLRWGEK